MVHRRRRTSFAARAPLIRQRCGIIFSPDPVLKSACSSRLLFVVQKPQFGVAMHGDVWKKILEADARRWTDKESVSQRSTAP